MDYKITKHYVRSEEIFIAEIDKFNNALNFVTKKLSQDEEEKKVIYRIYDENGLSLALNKENLSFTHANYAEGNADFNQDFLIFKVMINKNNLEKETLAHFIDKEDANLFIASQFENENTAPDKNIFFIFKNSSLVDTINESLSRNRQKAPTNLSLKAKGYSLSPLSTRPTPEGPPDYWVEREDDD